MPQVSASLAAYTEELRARWGVSALSVSLTNGRSQGFGHPTSGPMTPDTVCLVASNTKLFTAVAIGILVDQGKLSFDSKIKDLIPGFKVDNEHTTEHVTVADALSHSTGCQSGNICLAFRYDDTPKDMIDNICSARCANELKQTFAYDNRWFSVMAYVIEQLSGQKYSDFVTNHILKPLGMSNSTFIAAEAESKAATPTYILDDAKTTTDLPFFYARVKPGNAWEAPAGLFSTSSDLAKWIRYLMKIAKDAPLSSDEPKIISCESFKRIITPRVVCDQQLWFRGFDIGESGFPERSTPLYGLAVERYHLHGIDIASHNGTVPGYSSVTLWTPSKDFGIAIVANAVLIGSAVINLIALRAFEEHFGVPHLDWESRLREKEINWATGPTKLPSLDGYTGPPGVDIPELKGTYEARGCRSLLHVVGVNDDNLPPNVKHLRDRLLQQKVFGRPTGKMGLMAIWDTETSYLGDLFNLIHLGSNVFLADGYKLCLPPAGDGEGILLVYGSFSSPIIYALKDTEGRVVMEYKRFVKDKVPVVSQGEGDFTFVKINSF